MKAENNKMVAVDYTLTVDGKIADRSRPGQPLEFIFGTGMLLPKFEAAIVGKEPGEKVSFTLAPADGYGEIVDDAIVDLPKTIFMVDGKLAEDILFVGSQIPMANAQGQRMLGVVKEIGDDTVMMDFNHPMAGKTLNFDVEVISVRDVTPEDLAGKPATFETVPSKTKNSSNLQYRIQVYCEDCTGCGVCIETCPAKEKALSFVHLPDARKAGQDENAEFFEQLPDNLTEGASIDTVKGSQFLMPYFEFSGACAGCGETPYVKLVSQLFGNRMIVANATGCSSIYGGSFPSLPYCKDKSGRGPAWANSLFEDNAEYGFGMRIAVDTNRKQLMSLVKRALELGVCCDEFKGMLETAAANFDKTDADAIALQNKIGEILPKAIEKSEGELRDVLSKMFELKDYFVDKSVWILGGDGWAYDIGFGGLDHVVAQNRNVNILVLDTEVYSNTGGQASKSTPIGAVALFAAAGKRLTKKNLGFMCMSYGNVYVASIAMGANRQQTLKAIQEAEAHQGPSIILAYAPCIAHGIKGDMRMSQVEEKRAVDAGYWPLYRFNPNNAEKPFTWETKEATQSFMDFIKSERRYASLQKVAPTEADEVYAEAEADAKRRMEFFKNLGNLM